MMNSQNEVIQLVLMGALLALMSGFTVRFARMVYYKIKIELDYSRNPRVIAYSEEKACLDTHRWIELTLALRDLSPGVYNACIKCGALCGNEDIMISEYVLNQAREQEELKAKKLALEIAVADRIEELTDVAVSRYIMAEFIDEKQSLQFVNKLRHLVDYAFKAKQEAVVKVTHEIESQEELDARYKDWTKKRKGNA